MSGNPFLSTSVLNLPLRLDVCQRIHYVALRAAAGGLHSETAPSRIHLTRAREWARLHGSTVYLAHPAHIARVFGGVTLVVYKAIEQLYCSRLGRSIEMVGRILDAMADAAGVPAVDYEAVWAICIYLDERRADRACITMQPAADTWRIVQLTPAIHVQEREASVYRAAIVCVVSARRNKVLAFRIARRDDLDESVTLAIYDAIVSQRRPAREAGGGLVWRAPTQLACEVEVKPETRNACARIGIALSRPEGTIPLLPALRGNWATDLAGRALSLGHLALLFDNYLAQAHGYGPLRMRMQQGAEFAQRIGYNRDPAGFFPALRCLLPSHTVWITTEGAVEHDGLHYEDALLAYWPGHAVSLRRSELAEARAWIYLDGQILCQAMARELQRRDGSYRANRPGR